MPSSVALGCYSTVMRPRCATTQGECLSRPLPHSIQVQSIEDDALAEGEKNSTLATLLERQTTTRDTLTPPVVVSILFSSHHPSHRP